MDKSFKHPSKGHIIVIFTIFDLILYILADKPCSKCFHTNILFIINRNMFNSLFLPYKKPLLVITIRGSFMGCLKTKKSFIFYSLALVYSKVISFPSSSPKSKILLSFS